MKNIFTYLILTLLLLFASGIKSQEYFGVQPPDSGDSSLLVIDISTGNVVSTLPVSIPGTPISGYTGMARNPVDGVIYVVLRSGSLFKLATMGEDGSASFIADLSDKFASITFDAVGNLFGITGDGANVPSTIYSIDKTTGVALLEYAPPGGSDGEAIAFNTDNGLMYRYAGDGLFQSINLLANTTTLIDSLENIDNFAHALYYNSDAGDFVFTAGDTIYNLTATGTKTILSATNLSSGLKGLVKKVCAPQVVTVSLNGFTLTADSTAQSYQWIDCDNNNAPIAGETGQSFTASANGNYAVVATNDGCSDTSSCANVTGVGIADVKDSHIVNIYPNPATDVLNIEVEGFPFNAEIKVYDLIGNLVTTSEVISGTPAQLRTSEYSPGIYFIKLLINNELIAHKFTVK